MFIANLSGLGGRRMDVNSNTSICIYLAIDLPAFSLPEKLAGRRDRNTYINGTLINRTVRRWPSHLCFITPLWDIEVIDWTIG